MPEEYQFHPSGTGVIRLSDMAYIMPGDTDAWRAYMQRVYDEGYQASPAAAPLTQPRKLAKYVIVERLSDVELELFKVAKPTLPARSIFLWDEALNNEINPEDPRLIEAFTSIIGAERTAEVLS